jgi:predicted heme/steroid binding protein
MGYDLRKNVYDCINEICHYSQMQVFATSIYQKEYFQKIIDEKTQALVNNIDQYTLEISQVEQGTEKEFTLEELAANDGSNGKPCYVAVNGVVYDMSDQIAWAGGTHFGLYGGQNLSSQFMACHQGMVDILNKLKPVGVLK